jgi:hypothetical protein
MTEQPLRFVSWNLQGRPRLETLTDPRFSWDVLAFQEGTRESIPALAAGLREHGVQFDMATADQHLSHAVLAATGLTYFSGIAVRHPYGLTDPQVLAVPSPERTLVARVDGPAGRWTAASLALPPGVSWKQAKPRQALLIAEWLHSLSGTVIFGIDANTPRSELHLPEATPFWESRWFYEDERALLGAEHERRHGLRDVYRDAWLADPDRRSHLRGGDPLAVSHFASRGPGRPRERVRLSRDRSHLTRSCTTEQSRVSDGESSRSPRVV